MKGASKASKVSLTRFGSVDSASSQISALTLTKWAFETKLIYGRNSFVRATMFISLTSPIVIQPSLTLKNAPVCSQHCRMNSLHASQMYILICKSLSSSALLSTFPMMMLPLMCKWSWLNCKLLTFSHLRFLLAPLSLTSSVNCHTLSFHYCYSGL